MLVSLATALGRVLEIQQALQRLDRPSAATGAAAATTTDPASAAAPPAFAATLARAAGAPSSRTQFDDLIARAAAKYGVDEDLVHAVVKAESDYDPSSRSSCGAMGLMQLMPDTARGLGVSDPWDPAQNIDGGVRYLRAQLDRFHEVDLAVAAYNAGPGAVRRHSGVPPYAETQGYVRNVMRTLWQRKGQ